MLLRSSSTPVPGSLLSSFSESPNNAYHESTTPMRHPQTTIHHNHTKLSFHQTGSLNLGSFSRNSSPISPSIAELSNFDRHSIRRAQSEGNLQGLATASCSNYDELNNSELPQKPSRRPSCPALQTIPSFSFYGSRGGCANDEEEEEDGDEENLEREGAGDQGGMLEEPVEGGDRFMAVGRDEVTLEERKMGLFEEIEFRNGFGNVNFEGEQVGPQMYLAKGLGANADGCGGGGGGNGGGDFTPRNFGRDGGDGDDAGIEEHYKRMVEENPGNPLFLRNYAQFLYHSKRDLEGAEEYYSRAILADPKDGEILSQYAKLMWELHHDKDRTSSYFERSVQAAPEDSHVLAAYASFLWETEKDEDEVTATENLDAVPPLYHKGTMASATANV